MSNRRFFDVDELLPLRALEELEDLPADQTLDASLRVTGSLPLCDLARDVRLRNGIESHRLVQEGCEASTVAADAQQRPLVTCWRAKSSRRL
jgi:hypothetical protein